MCGSVDLFLRVLVANDVIMHVHEAHLLCDTLFEQVGAMLVVDDCEFDPVLVLGFTDCQLDHALSHWLQSCGISHLENLACWFDLFGVFSVLQITQFY